MYQFKIGRLNINKSIYFFYFFVQKAKNPLIEILYIVLCRNNKFYFIKFIIYNIIYMQINKLIANCNI